MLARIAEEICHVSKSVFAVGFERATCNHRREMQERSTRTDKSPGRWSNDLRCCTETDGRLCRLRNLRRGVRILGVD